MQSVSYYLPGWMGVLNRSSRRVSLSGLPTNRHDTPIRVLLVSPRDGEPVAAGRRIEIFFGSGFREVKRAGLTVGTVADGEAHSQMVGVDCVVEFLFIYICQSLSPICLSFKKTTKKKVGQKKNTST